MITRLCSYLEPSMENGSRKKTILTEYQQCWQTDPDLPAEPTQAQRDSLRDKLRRQCKVFLSQVAKCVSHNHYLEIIPHTTSLTWVFNLIKRDYDLRVTGSDFLNLTGIKYESATMTSAAFYQKVKSHITANTARAGQVIQNNNN